ncbi:glutathione S-transferase family protein [Novispirillum itersonii]|uniref:Glutathione S-transferase n=1 Tax=Novispirillum itersonii TaxID=189 RepID=A0A7W9ZDJ4_NOVIT|nr:glutathione S-transferase N-terminal domain-containing protein [Novispirillum itersonii]MBB6209380.1 glutathione S-transferase [Novispirillum itersonii]
MITVYGRPSSINVRKVLWLCDELGLTIARAAQNYDAPGPEPVPEVLALNPNGLIPVLTDDGHVLWESNTICRYLAGKAGRTDLLPADITARSRVEQWMDWQATELNTSWRTPFMGLIRKSPAHSDPQALAAGIAGWNRTMGLLDDQISRTGAYVTGETFTLADVVLGVSVHRWLHMPMQRPDLPGITGYYRRLLSRPAFPAHARPDVP